MAWFKRKRKGIQTNTKDKKDTPDGLWHKTPSGKIVDNDELVNFLKIQKVSLLKDICKKCVINIGGKKIIL